MTIGHDERKKYIRKNKKQKKNMYMNALWYTVWFDLVNVLGYPVKMLWYSYFILTLFYEGTTCNANSIFSYLQVDVLFHI